ncbi:MAG: hypothetical protein AB7Q81_04975 [Gammaproteobacteria bacterium]
MTVVTRFPLSPTGYLYIGSAREESVSDTFFLKSMAAWALPTCSGCIIWFNRIGLDRQLAGGPDRCRKDSACLQGLCA